MKTSYHLMNPVVRIFSEPFDGNSCVLLKTRRMWSEADPEKANTKAMRLNFARNPSSADIRRIFGMGSK